MKRRMKRSGAVTVSRSHRDASPPGARILPSFLIVGAQRCGTTSLYRALAQHPLLLKPVLHKGVHYFDVAYDQGLPGIGRTSRCGCARRCSAGRYGAAPQAFESSPYYLFHPLAGERIAATCPG